MRAERIGGEPADGISITSVIDSASSTREGRDGKTRFSESASSTTNRLSTITVGGDASFATPGAFSVKGAEISADGALNADAGSIALEGVTDRASVTVDTLRKTSGLLTDAGGYIVNLATGGWAFETQAERTTNRIDGAIELGKQAMTDPVGTATKLGEAYVEPYLKGAEQLKSGQTYEGTATISEASADLIAKAATGAGGAVAKVPGAIPGGKIDLPAPKKLPIPNNLGKSIHSGAQDKYIPGTNNYDPTKGRSILTADPTDLLNGVHSGKYPIVRMAGDKPIVDFGKPIGTYGENGPQTQFGTIHSGKNGVHIVPANPTQY
ncbi:polymorphic toxin type 50 domain-containing protein [Sphingomonas cavernae]|uniref:Bacterial toxin 50 domain-containing protein n=1 Tax=Sphingomonas cavernae TaxID=2320861 RepID=A0A418WJS8_9SPHN|nr:polymorphic toxin type 50 domain-containing protein [Sphingomonas cavernae]RJF90284.1 hypothetical protein D3876_08415 [Sphingomonas cavernae]